MFTVSVETRFWASHQLTLEDGTKEALHYHNWLVSAEVGRDRLDNMGLVIDFHRLKAMVEGIIAEFDNTALEKNDYFQRNFASAENVAKYVYEKLADELQNGVKLDSIRVTEGDGFSAKFSK